MIYQWREGTRANLKKHSPQRVGERLNSLKQRLGGKLPVRAILAEAKQLSSPLHPLFTWSDSKAATLYRLEEARSICQQIIVVKVRNGVDQTSRFLTHISIQGNAYVTTEDTRINPEYRAEIVDRAIHELAHWRDKYGDLSELSPLLEAIESAWPVGHDAPKRERASVTMMV